MRVYSVEGAVGAGKTEFLRHLQAIRQENGNMIPRTLIVSEPVDEWMRVSFGADMGPLQAQYRYPTMYGAQFQMYAYASHLHNVCERLAEHVAIHNRMPEVLIVERFPGYSNYHVFMRALHDQGFVDDVSLTMARRTFDALEDAEIFRTMAGRGEYLSMTFVNVMCGVDESLRRVRERARERAAEDRLRRIHARYDAWLNHADVWLDDRHLTVHEVQQVDNRGDIDMLRESAEEFMNRELNRPVLQRDMMRDPMEDAMNHENE